MKGLLRSRWLHPALLLVWIAVGAMVRLIDLTTHPLWTDEFSTLVFSLGHSFRTVPLNQVIAPETLLQPLVRPAGSVGDVVQHLMTESTHPPLYFVLANLWMRLFSPQEGLVSLWAARSLPVVFGILAIPAMFSFGWIAFHSRLVGQLAAALMAVSPFGVYLAQDARHYTLAVLWGIASMVCFAITLQTLQQRSQLPLKVTFTWIAVNALGMATHYFFGLLLIAEGLTLLGSWIWDRRFWRGGFAFRNQKPEARSQNLSWKRIYWVAAGTLVGSLVWLPAWQSSYNNELTQWVYSGEATKVPWLQPIFYTLASGMTMLTVLPIQQVVKPIPTVSAIVVILFCLWAWWLAGRGFRTQLQQPGQRWLIQGLAGIIGSAVALLLILDYGLNSDITRAFRYSFIYFPAVIVLIAAGLSPYWGFSQLSALIPHPPSPIPHPPSPIPHPPSPASPLFLAVPLIWLLGLIGALTVASGFAYQKTHRPDLVVDLIREKSQAPVVVAIAHHTHGQTGRLMGLAWELRQPDTNASFYLDHQTCKLRKDQPCNFPTPQLHETLKEIPRPFDLWLINYQGIADLTTEQCDFDNVVKNKRVDGYKSQRYHCP